MLRITGVELELMQDPEQYAFIEQGIRGGVSQISGRSSNANNPLAHSPQSPYDPEKPSGGSYTRTRTTCMGGLWERTHCLRGTSGGSAQPEVLVLEQRLQGAQLVPGELEGHSWTEEINGARGHILEVDLDYPEHLHDLHSDFPLAPERLVIKDDMLSPYCRRLKEGMGHTMGKSPRGGETGAQPHAQAPLCAGHAGSALLPLTGSAASEGAPSTGVQAGAVAECLHRSQHRAEEAGDY